MESFFQRYLDLFAPLAPAGLESLDIAWNRYLSFHFRPEFPLFWLLILAIGWLLGRRWPSLAFPLAEWKPHITVHRWVPRVVFLLANLFLLAILFRLGGHPHVMDNISVHLQARMMAEGFWRGVPLPPEFGDTLNRCYLFTHDQRWLSVYPPGMAMFLTPFAKFRAEWLGQIVLLNLNLLLWGRLLGLFFTNPAIQSLGWILALASPAFLVTHAFTFPQTLVLAIVMSVILFFRAEQWEGAILAASLAFFIRPMDGTILLLFVFVRYFHRLYRGKNSVSFSRLALLAGVGPLLLFAYNFLVFGRADGFGYSSYSPRIHLGFGAEVGEEVAYGHNLYSAFWNGTINFLILQEDLLGWPCLSLFPLLILFVKRGGERFSSGGGDRPLWALMGLYLLFYGAFFYHGITIGARYYFPLWGLFLLLSLKSIETFQIFQGRWLLPLILFSLVMTIPPHFERMEDFDFVLSHPENFLRPDYDREKFIVVIEPSEIAGRPLMDSFLMLNEPWRGHLDFVTPRTYSAIRDRETRIPILLNLLKLSNK